MDDLDTTETVILRGEECPYDPVRRIALVVCENCGQYNQVECDLDEDNIPLFSGFVCEKCGHWNGQ